MGDRILTSDYCALPVLPAHLARFAVDEAGCWIWQGGRNGKGYGAVNVAGRVRSAHREVYGALVTPVPDELTLDHLCRVHACVNPAHLEPTTSRENTLRSPQTIAGIHARQTHCKHGHEFTPDNTYLYEGRRYCRTCQRTVWGKG